MPKRAEGPPGVSRRPSEHGQRPECSSPGDLEKLSLSSPERANPTPLLNHETSDHLLSLVEHLGTMSRTKFLSKSCFHLFWR